MQAIMPRAMEGTRPATVVAPQARLYYLDHLRAGIMALVMLHHTAIMGAGLARWLPTVRVAPTFPDGWAIGALIAVLGAASFLVRLVVPVGATFLSLQLAYFPSYVAMFGLGLVAWRQGWLDAIPDRAVRRAGWTVAIRAACLVFTQRHHAGAAGAAFHGGPNVKALVTAVWEQFVLVGMSVILLRWGQPRLNRPSPRWQGWSGASYAAYIIQPLVPVPLSILFSGQAWPALVKFGVVGLLTVAAAYVLARALRLIRPLRAALG